MRKIEGSSSKVIVAFTFETLLLARLMKTVNSASRVNMNKTFYLMNCTIVPCWLSHEPQL